MTAFRFENTIFRPGDAYQISGYNPENQRNLRRAGHIGKDGDGWSSYSLDEMAALFVMGKLSELANVPPSASKSVGKTAGNRVILFAFDLPGAIHDPAGLNKDHEIPIKHSVAATKMRFLVWQDGEGHFLDKLDDGFFSRKSGAVILLDLHELAEEFLRRVGGPLTTVVAEF